MLQIFIPLETQKRLVVIEEVTDIINSSYYLLQNNYENLSKYQLEKILTNLNEGYDILLSMSNHY